MDMPSINLTLTGANIVAMREAAGLSVKDLQKFFGFNSPQAIYKWQNGVSLPSVDNLVILARIRGRAVFQQRRQMHRHCYCR